MFFTVADNVTGSVSTGDVGENDEVVTVRSGLGDGVPNTWNSATWPPGAPVLLVIDSSTSATRPLTGMVILLPFVAGLNVYCCAATSVVKVEELCSRPSTAMVWVRVDQIGSGFSATTTEDRSAFAPSCTVAWAGKVAPSKYVVRSPSLALVTAKVNVLGVPVIGLPSARFVVGPPVPLRVTVLLAADWLPAASFATTKYITVAVSGWASLKVNVVPLTVASWVPLRNTTYCVTPMLSVAAPQVSVTWPEDGVVTARLVGAVGGVVSPDAPVRVTLLELADWLPAASCARTK